MYVLKIYLLEIYVLIKKKIKFILCRPLFLNHDFKINVNIFTPVINYSSKDLYTLKKKYYINLLYSSFCCFKTFFSSIYYLLSALSFSIFSILETILSCLFFGGGGGNYKKKSISLSSSLYIS